MSDLKKASSTDKNFYDVQVADVKEGTTIPIGADAALAYLQQQRQQDGSTDISEDVDERRLVRRIDRIIMPLMWGCYFLQYTDKTLVNYANVMGLQGDTGTSASQFSYLALAFYCSYLVCEPIHAYLMQRFPTAKYLGVQVVCWGICVLMNCACKSFASLIALRVLLGVFESAVAPSLILISGMWYKKTEQPFRIGIWYLGTGSGTIIGAIASFGFQHVTSTTFKSWQIMFLTFGLITIVVGVLVIFLLPDNPMNAWFLSPAEKLLAIERLRGNKTGIENKTFKKEQMVECVKDPHTWLLSMLTICSNVTNGAASSFTATIIKALGYDSKTTALLSIPGGAVSIISILSATFVAGRTNTRHLNIVALIIPTVIGGGLMAFAHGKIAPLIGNYMIQTIGASLPLIYSIAAANYAGHTKKVTINAIVLMSFCLGNIIGPLTFTGASAPDYIPAKITIMVTGCVAILFAIGLWLTYISENKRRDRRDNGVEHMQNFEFMDITDRQNKEFRYVL